MREKMILALDNVNKEELKATKVAVSYCLSLLTMSQIHSKSVAYEESVLPAPAVIQATKR